MRVLLGPGLGSNLSLEDGTQAAMTELTLLSFRSACHQRLATQKCTASPQARFTLFPRKQISHLVHMELEVKD